MSAGAAILIAVLISQTPAKDQDVAKATERLEKALATLKSAAEKIEKDKPTDADFNGARAALDALKLVLDEGNNLEAKDLQYARLALTARKELRSKRDRIEQRRLEIRLAIGRDDIEQAVADFDAALQRIEGKDAVEDNFARAVAAADEVMKALERNQTLVGLDAKFTEYVEQVHTRVEAKRKTIDERRVAMGAERVRTKIEAGRRVLTAAMAALREKNPSEDQFRKAETAAEAVVKLLSEGKSFEGRNKAYTTFASEVNKEVTAAKAQIDERKTELASAAQQVELESVRQVLAEAMQALNGRNPSDELFEEATKAASLMDRMLAQSEALPAKSRLFSQYLADLRKSLKGSQAEIEKRKFDVQLPRQRRRVEDARGALVKAIGELKGNDVPEEKFAAAEAAARSAEKILEEGALFARRDAQYAAYAREAKKRIQELVVRIPARRTEIAVAKQRSEVQAAKEAFSGALKQLSSPDTKEADFDEAKTAAIVLEKTLEAAEETKRKDARFATYWADSKKYLESQRPRIEERRIDFSAAQQRMKVEVELSSLSDAMSGIEGFAANEAAFKAASDALGRVRTAIEGGAELEKKVARYATWANQARRSADQAAQRLEKRKLELDVTTQASMLEKLLAAAKMGVEAAKREDATDQHVAAALTSVKTARDDLAKAASLEKKDKSYASFATQAKEQLSELQQEAENAGHMVAFRKGPVAALMAGLTALESAGGENELEPQRDAYAGALAKFQACQNDSANLIAEHPKIAGLDFSVGNARVKAKSLISTCAGHAESTEEKLAHVKAILAVYEGPARSFEQAKAALAKAMDAKEPDKKTAMSEALKHFEVCLEKGKILQYKFPKLAEQKFDVAGKKLTLSAVVTDCQQSAKTIRATLQGKKN